MIDQDRTSAEGRIFTQGVRVRETDDPPGDGGPHEAVAFIAENVADLARVARRHNLEMLVHLLEMALMEAQERIQLRGKRNLS